MKPVTTCAIGINGKVDNKHTRNSAQPFNGELGSFFFFNEALSDTDFKHLQELNAKEFMSFNPGVVGSSGDPKLQPKVLFGFSPQGLFQKQMKNNFILHFVLFF